MQIGSWDRPKAIVCREVGATSKPVCREVGAISKSGKYTLKGQAPYLSFFGRNKNRVPSRFSMHLKIEILNKITSKRL